MEWRMELYSLSFRVLFRTEEEEERWMDRKNISIDWRSFLGGSGMASAWYGGGMYGNGKKLDYHHHHFPQQKVDIEGVKAWIC
jgi:hypothetical protein